MTDHGRDARLAMVAERQAGTFSFAQAVEAGFPSSTIGRRLALGTWERSFPGVYVLAGTPPSRLRELWSAVLAVGPSAVLTHETSALIHGAERVAADPIVLTVPHGGHHRLGGLVVHQIGDLRSSHRTSVGRLPVSTAARAVVELGATSSVELIGRVADDLVRAQRTSFAQIGAVLAQLARPGKPGLGRVAQALDMRTGGYVPPSSELERVLFATLEAGGLPAPTRQVPLPGRGPTLGLVDGAYTDALVVLEADGRRWHTRMEAARRDRERDAQVVRAGWVPLRFVYEQIVNEPREVCAIVTETRERRLALLQRAA